MMSNQGPGFSVIGAQAVKTAIASNLEACVRVIKDAYLAHDAGMTVNPKSVFLQFPDTPSARIIALPAHLRGDSPVSGIKWISSYPENHQRKLPRASAVLILNDALTGFPIACLEGSLVSATRTAASAAIAAGVIRKGAHSVGSLGIVGAGLIARNVVSLLLGTGWRILHLDVYDVNAGKAGDFVAWIKADGRIATSNVCSSAHQVCGNSEVVVLATVASVPHISELDSFVAGQTILHLSLRDLSPAIIRSVNNVVDDPSHVVTAGTSIALAATETGNTDFITGTLADLMLDRKSLDASKATVFSPFGLGMLDIALGRWVYDRTGPGSRVPVADFFDTN